MIVYLKSKIFVFSFLVFFLFLLFLLGLCKSREIRPISSFSDRRHIGSWFGKDSARRGQIILYPNGFAFFSAMGQSFGGPELNPKKGALLYEVDYDSKPIKLDLIGVDPKYRELRRIKMIVEFLNPKRMRACTYMTDHRPPDFDSKRPCRVILLEKKK